MKPKFLIFSVLILVFFASSLFISCSSGSDQTNKASEKKASNFNNFNNSNSFGNSNSSSNESPITNNVSSQNESSNSNQTVFLDPIEERRKKIAEMTKNAPPAKVDPSQMKNATTILPDGSEFWAILDAKGVTETRVFKNHPQLDKVVRFTDGKNVTVKVYTKDKKVISVSKDKLKNLTQDSAEQILAVAGIKTAEPKEIQTEKQSEKKNQKVEKIEQ
jgi:hypothetical protein